MQKDGLDQLMVFCSLSHHLWKLREELRKQREGTSAFLAEALLQIPKSQGTGQSETKPSSKRGWSPRRNVLRRLKPKNQATMGEQVTKAGRDEVWL